MNDCQWIIEEMQLIKRAINQIEIKGEANANNLLFACQKLDALISFVSENANKQNEMVGE